MNFLDEKCKLMHLASKSLCLARYFRLIVGSRVDVYDKYWQTYKLLSKIIGILALLTFRKSGMQCLESLVNNHNSMYTQLFLAAEVTFYHWHNNLKIGLPTCYWSFPFEMYNKDMKK